MDAMTNSFPGLIAFSVASFESPDLQEVRVNKAPRAVKVERVCRSFMVDMILSFWLRGESARCEEAQPKILEASGRAIMGRIAHEKSGDS